MNLRVLSKRFARQPPVFARLRRCLSGEVCVRGCEIAETNELEPRYSLLRLQLSQPALRIRGASAIAQLLADVFLALLA